MPSKKKETKAGTKNKRGKNIVEVAVFTEGGRTSETITCEIMDYDSRRQRLVPLRNSYSGKTAKYKKSVLFRRSLNKKARTRGRYAIVHEEGPGGKGDGGNPPIITVSIEE